MTLSPPPSLYTFCCYVQLICSFRLEIDVIYNGCVILCHFLCYLQWIRSLRLQFTVIYNGCVNLCHCQCYLHWICRPLQDPVGVLQAPCWSSAGAPLCGSPVGALYEPGKGHVGALQELCGSSSSVWARQPCRSPVVGPWGH